MRVQFFQYSNSPDVLCRHSQKYDGKMQEREEQSTRRTLLSSNCYRYSRAALQMTVVISFVI